MTENTLCRICLRSKSRVVNLFDRIDVMSYVDKLTLCIPHLNIAENDGYPKEICTECCKLLETTYEFHNLCIQSDRQLHDTVKVWLPLFDNNKTDVEDVELDKFVNKRRRRKQSVKKNFKRRSHSECYDENGKYIRNPERRFKCKICNRAFYVQQTLTNHMTIHTGELPFTCEICGKSFTQRSSIMIHLKTHSSDAIKHLQCNQCPYRTLYSSSLARHAAVHSTVLKFQCTVCGKKTKNKHQLGTHTKNVHSTLSLPCEFCGKIFRTNRSLRMHIDRHSSSSILKINFDNNQSM